MKKPEPQVNPNSHIDHHHTTGQKNRTVVEKIVIGAGQTIDNVNDPLEKVYIEVTNACNLECRTCMRNVWDEPIGYMGDNTFLQVMDGLHTISNQTHAIFWWIRGTFCSPQNPGDDRNGCETGVSGSNSSPMEYYWILLFRQL